MAMTDSTIPLIDLNLPPDPYADDPYSILFVWFKPILEFPGYGVDTEGIVWSCLLRRGRAGFASSWHKVRRSRKGRLNVVLCRGNERHTKRIYRLVLETFVGPCPPGKEACHYDDDQSNNRLYNLRWDFHKSNCVDRSRNGKTPIGSDAWAAKYDDPTIARVKGLIAEGIRPTIIAELIGVSRAIVQWVKAGHGWSHVPAVLDADDISIARDRQAQGTRNNVWLEHDGRRMIAEDWAKHLGISSVTIRTRLSRGWPLERVLCAKNFKFKGTRDGG